jgi:MFS family permease
MTNPAESSSETPSAFASLRVPSFQLLWWGSAFSFMGVQMQFLLRGLLAWDLTGRESAFGLVFLSFGLCMLIFTPLGGVAADRFKKRRLLVLGQLVLMLVAVGMGAAVLTGHEQFWMLLVASGSQGATFGFIGPARVSMTYELVGRELLGNAISLSILSMSTTRIFAPALAGLLAGVSAVGIGGGYLVSGVFSVTSLVLALRLPDFEPRNSTPKNPFREIADGVRYVAGNRRVKRLVISSTAIIMFGFNYTTFLTPMVKEVFERGNGSVGFMSTASSVGAVLISIPVAKRADSAKAGHLLIASGIGFGVTVMALSVAPSYWWAVGVVVMIGGSTTGYQALSNSMAMASSSSDQHGRVQSLMQLSFAGFGIAALPLGALAEWIGLRQSIAVMGAVTLLATLAYAGVMSDSRAPEMGASS